MSDPDGAAREIEVACCIAGGGPAGMMLGFLLARAGIGVAVLEKHADFLRDFRGDTIHPSTLELMGELGLLDAFLARPHQKAYSLTAQVGDESTVVADFSHLPTRCKFIAFMPQWDFLDFIADEAARCPGFHLLMRAEAESLIEEGGVVAGLRASTPQGPLTVRAPLVIGADGRHSTVRRLAGLRPDDLGAPMDVLWMRISRQEGDPSGTFAHIDRGGMLVMIRRDEYWQCAFVIEKGAMDRLRDRGIENFRADILRFAPYLGGRVDELQSWDDVKLLTVAVDRLRCWHRPGVLCIGDAAHAMSPIGGVGINLAVQDAVAAANILTGPLRRGETGDAVLHRVQRRRAFPARVTQRMQLIVQDRVIRRILASTTRPELPVALRLLRRFPALTRIPARLIGIGVRPEHVQTDDAA
ncbi:MAG: FAD-dependent oxidoreductase [Alphaproteobacteria bacterium]|nr:FAD-dependent oxidoreductase [Alphaproteobacteria bacterium]